MKTTGNALLDAPVLGVRERALAPAGWAAPIHYTGRVQTVYDSHFFQIKVDERRTVMWMVRTAESSKDLDFALREVRKLTRVFAAERTSKMCLIVDVRAVLGRNDEAFESTLLPHFLDISDRFQRVGMLVATPVGKIQVMRLARERRVPYEVFFDEASARAFAGLGPADG